MSNHTTDTSADRAPAASEPICAEDGEAIQDLILARCRVKPEQFGDDRATQTRRLAQWLRQLNQGQPLIRHVCMRRLIERFRLADEAARDGTLRVLTPSSDQPLGWESRTRREWFSQWWDRVALPTDKSIRSVNQLSILGLVADWEDEFAHIPVNRSPRPTQPSALSWLDVLAPYTLVKRVETPGCQVMDRVRQRHHFDLNDPEPTVSVKKLNDELANYPELSKANRASIKDLLLSERHKKGGRPKKRPTIA